MAHLKDNYVSRAMFDQVQADLMALQAAATPFLALLSETDARGRPRYPNTDEKRLAYIVPSALYKLRDALPFVSSQDREA